MDKIYEGKLSECKELGEMVFETDFHIDGEVIGRPVFNYAKTGKLFGKLDFVYNDENYTLLMYNYQFINLLIKK